MSNFDYKIFLWINSAAGRNIVLDKLGIFFAVYGIYVMVAMTVILAFWSRYWKNFFIAAISAFISRFVIVELIKIWVNRPRPFEVLPVHLLVPDTGTGQAFSSGHAVLMFSIAFSFYRTKFFWPFIVWASISSVARIFIGVHYPLDVIASVAIAALVVWGIDALSKRVRIS